MKKSLLLAVLVIGAASASQAGVRFGVGFGLPLPLPVPRITITQPAPVCEPTPPPVYTAPETCYTPGATVYQTPLPVIVEQPRAYIGFNSFDHGHYDRHYRGHEQNHSRYSHDRRSSEHSHDGHRW